MYPEIYSWLVSKQSQTVRLSIPYQPENQQQCYTASDVGESFSIEFFLALELYCSFRLDFLEIKENESVSPSQSEGLRCECGLLHAESGYDYASLPTPDETLEQS